jgi:hypothetical protein
MALMTVNGRELTLKRVGCMSASASSDTIDAARTSD